jgi:DNA-directed RNA polymerase subunit L
MEIKPIKNEKNYIELEFIDCEPSILNALVDNLIDEKDVEFCTVKLDHPQIGNPIFVLRTNKADALELLKKAIKKLKEDVASLEKNIKK